MDDGERSSGVRLAELVAALSLATDLGLGLPQEHVLRQTVIARRLAEAAGLSDAQLSAVFYVSVLAWVGCISDSHELARWVGDDRRLRSDSYQVDKVGLPMMRLMIGHVSAGSPPLRRLTMIGRFLAGGFNEASGAMVAHCQTTGDIADRLGLESGVRRALGQSFERWDGKGIPSRCAGDQIDPVMRVVQISDDAEVFLRAGGVDAAVEMLRSRRGTEFDPALVDLFCTRAAKLVDGLDDLDSWEITTTGGELAPELTEAALTGVLRVFGDYADLKSPSWLGHSGGGSQAGPRRGAAPRVAGLRGDPRRASRARPRPGGNRSIDGSVGQGGSAVAQRARAGAHPPLPH